MTKKEKKTCFIICPLSKQNSEIRKRSDDLMNHIIKPVVEELGYDLKRADLAVEEKISDTIHKQIFDADIVVADLSDHNPNVYFELGKRHAWKGACIHLINNLADIPYNLTEFRVLDYDLEDLDKMEEVRKSIYNTIKQIEKTSPKSPFPLSKEDIINLFGVTVLMDRVSGRRDHYEQAKNLTQKNIKKIFLMQRSSTLILGPEKGWGEEKTFYKYLLETVKKGVEFYHIISTEGIKRHLERKYSVFPEVKKALNELERKESNNKVAIRSPRENGDLMFFKKIPDIEKDNDLKPDRQARVFIIEDHDGCVEGIIVIDLGGSQSAFHLKGEEMKKYFKECIKFYEDCDYIDWSEIDEIVEAYQ